MKSKDKRYLETEQLITNVFIELVETRGYSNVTVKDIAKYANINRNTFYLHYLDKEDLMDHIAKNVFEEIINKLIDIDLYRFNRQEYKNNMNKLLDILFSQTEIIRILLKDPNLTGYFDTLERKIIEFVIEKNTSITPYAKARIDFKVSGFFGVLKQWILYDRYTKEDMLHLFNKELF